MFCKKYIYIYNDFPCMFRDLLNAGERVKSVFLQNFCFSGELYCIVWYCMSSETVFKDTQRDFKIIYDREKRIS